MSFFQLIETAATAGCIAEALEGRAVELGRMASDNQRLIFPPPEPIETKNKRTPITKERQKNKQFPCFKNWQIVLNNLPSLLAAGWSRELIFRRTAGSGRLRQGIGFLSVWGKQDLAVSIDQSTGTIHFTFTNPAGRRVRQSATLPPFRLQKTHENSLNHGD